MNTDNSAVSWGAIFAGAAGAAALSLVLFVLGTGLGLAAVSPWSNDGISAGAAGVSSIVWVTVVQLLASVLGGYLAGRLRSRWVTVHTNEVYFRDTAHGFLAWAVSTLLMATLLSSALAGMAATGVKAGGAVAGSAVAAAGAGAATMAAGAKGDDSNGYFIDSLFRAPPTNAAAPAANGPVNNAAAAPTPDKAPEVARIFANALKTGELSQADTQYVGQLVAAKTGMAPADAEKRVTDTFNQTKDTIDQAAVKAKQVADEARKKSAWLAIWLVVSLFIGAFVASVSATFGGRLRDSSVLATTA